MAQGFLNRNAFKTKEATVNGLKAFDSDTITVNNTVKFIDLTGTKSQATAVHIYVDSNGTGKVLRYTYDGSTPAAGTGIARLDNDEFVITEATNIQKFRVIEESSNTTTLFITYLK